MKRILLIVGSVVLALATILVACAALMLGTERGARLAVGRLAPFGLTVERVEGRLLGPLALHGVEYRNEAAHVSLDRLELDWAPSRILRRTVHVRGIDVDGVHARLLEAEEDPQPREPLGPLGDIELPVRIVLDRIRLTDIAITSPAAESPFHIDEIALNAHASGSEMVLGSLDVASPQLRLAARGALTTAGDYPLELDLDWDADLPDTNPLSGAATVRGSLADLRVSHQLTAPVPADLAAQATDVLGDTRWQLEANVPTFILQHLRGELPAHQLGLRLTASGGLDTAEAEATFTGLLDETGAFDGDLRLAYGDSGIAIDQLALRLPTKGGELALTGNVSLAAERPRAELDGQWSRLAWPLEGETSFTSPVGTFRVEGDSELFAVTVDATAGPADAPPSRWQINGEGTSTGFELRRLRGELADGHVEVTGTFAWAPGDFETIDGQLRLSGTHDEVGSVSGDVGLRYATSGLHIPSVDLHVPGTDARLTASGEVLLDAETPRFSFTAGWEDVAWPFQPESSAADTAGKPQPLYASPSGKIGIEGDANRYTVSLAAALGGSAVPAGSWELTGVGSTSSFALERLYGETLEGRVLAQGDVGWDPTLSWDIVATADEINPGVFVDSLPGLLSTEIVTKGVREDGELRGGLRLVRLDGHLRGQPVTGFANVEFAGEALRLDTLSLSAGAAQLYAAGSVADDWAMTWRLAAPDLSTLHPDAAGKLSATGTVNGARRTPLVRLELSADSLALFEPLSEEQAELLARADHSDAGQPTTDTVADSSADGREPRAGPAPGAEELPLQRRAAHRVDSLRADVAIDLSDQTASSLNVSASGLAAGGFLIEQALARGGGDTRDHELTVTANTGEDTIDLALRGSLVDQQWRGAIDRFNISGVLAGAWRMTRPAPLRLAADSVALEPLCWIGDEAHADPPDAPASDAEICLNGQWSREAGGRGALNIDRLPLGLFSPHLAQGAALEGLLSVSAEGELDVEGELRGHARVDAGAGALRYRLPNGEQAERRFDTLRASLLAGSDTINADLAFQLDDGTGINGAFTLPRSGAPGSQPVYGQINGELHDNGLLGALFPDLAATAGTLRVDVDLAGTAAEPNVTGTVALENGAADLPLPGLQLRDVDFRATADGSKTWTLGGGLSSGDGRVTLDGTLRVPSTDTEWGGELRLSGENFDAFQTSLARVTISPDLTLRASPGRTEVSGEVHVPRSTITPRDLTGTVLASPDVVIVGDTTATAAPMNLGLHTNVRVVLGDSVHFDGMGLTGKLEGNVVVIDEPGRLTTGRGELRVVDGEYTAFRQTLEIERGRLIFGDGPVEDPGLDMRVVRDISNPANNDSIVGMNVRGTLKVPQVSLFSEPQVAGGDGDILCYLMVGRPCPREGGGQLVNTDDLAQSLGLAGGNLLAGRIGQRLGFEEARIESDQGLEDAALFLGTHLCPRLYVAYGIGLFDAGLSTIRLRYTLAGGWALRAESGQQTGADLLYTIER